MYRIGIDLGGTFVKAGLVDENGRIVVKSKIPTKIERPYVEVFEDMANQARKLCEDAGITLADVEKVGVGCPGAITSKTGVVSYSANFNWTDVPIADGLSALLGMPVKVSNDANVAALGEAIYGAARNYGDSIMFTLGTGVGGGI
ncbi:MAG: ROK family protein, partial [Clostridia bacterium]|nr:ROK family protein [Clostridia bacterium]